jgi:hypothetical protein
MGSVDLRELSIGGELNSSKRFLISYSLSSGYGKKFSLDPPVPITGPEDGGLKLVNGDYDIRVENSKNHKGTYLFVTLE